MSARRGRWSARGARAAVAALALAAAGCGIGPGERDEGEATLTVTRDYGAEEMLEATVSDPASSETVMRMLDREAEVDTRYGGGFVQAINGVAGGSEDGRRFDWFFYVNGIESPVGAAEATVGAGDRIWWDHHDWSETSRVPAVVGSFPEPFASEAGGRPVEVSCFETAHRVCEDAVERLEQEGAAAELIPSSAENDHDDGAEGAAASVIVGPWEAVRDHDQAALLEGDPESSHVFARFERRGGQWELSLLDQGANEGERLGAEAGLVAATAPRGRAVWLVTGTDEGGVERAVEALEPEILSDRFAVAIAPGEEAVGVPLR